MLENLPHALGHALTKRRAGLDKIAFNAIDRRLPVIDLRSAAFVHCKPIPALYTADGIGVSPPLEWRSIPGGGASLVLMVEDADAPTSHPLVHAIVVDLAPLEGALPEGALRSKDHAGTGLKLGRNSYLQTSWLPPDPPPGHGVHRYAFQMFLLSEGPAFSAAPGRGEMLDAVRRRALARGCLIGMYERPSEL